MSDFKLSEVARRANLTVEEAVEKLKNAGESVQSARESLLTVDQVKILGVDPQHLIDRRKERLQQARQRLNKGNIGKEVIMKNRKKNVPIATNSSAQSKIISKEDLLKRKMDLNKEILKIDEERKKTVPNEPLSDKTDVNVAHSANSSDVVEVAVKESANVSDDTPLIKDTILKKDDIKEAIIQDTHSAIEENDAISTPPVVISEPVKEAAPASIVKDVTVERAPSISTSNSTKSHDTSSDKKHRDAVVPTQIKRAPASQRPTGPSSSQDHRPTSSSASRPPSHGRPTGPAADKGRSYSNAPRSSVAPGRKNFSNDESSQDKGGDRYNKAFNPAYSKDRKDYRSTTRPDANKKTAPSTDALLLEEEKKRRDLTKKTKEIDPTKEESKKPKLKVKSTDIASTKLWTKTITEGISELDIEKEIEEQPKEVEVVKPVAPVYSKRAYKKSYKNKDKEQPVFVRPTSITIGESVTVAELASMIGVKASELLKKLFNADIMVTINQYIDSDTAALISLDYGVEVHTKIITEDDLLPTFEDKPEDYERRSPVVTVMGHVDHGKTSLLDALRSTAVAQKEAGGITQHIGAYEVEINGRKITFLDTPGHEAFTSLRARGAQVTDIVILVVAVNDGVMPQTKEAIDHAKAAGVKIVVALNKIDLSDANPDRVRQQLAEYGVISDEWGGEYQFQPISAKKKIGIEDLLERVLLEADILDLKGNPKAPAAGIVIESRLDRHKGPIATVLVNRGTLNRGDTFVIGKSIGKVRAMYNYLGNTVKQAGISMPVEVTGFDIVPESGDTLTVINDEKIARSVVELRSKNDTDKRLSPTRVSLTDFFDKVKQDEIKELNIIIKADVQGSLEALKGSLLKLSNLEVKLNVVHDATGGINESDVVLSLASNAIIIGFNVRPDAKAKSMADKEGVSIELYSVIYEAIEDVKLAMEGLLTPDTRESIIGKVEVRQVFSVPKLGKIAGAYVLEGKVNRNSKTRVIRDNVVIYDGKVGSLRRFSDDVKEVAHGFECGISVDRYQDIKEKDILEIYEIVEEKRTLDDVKFE